MRTNLGCTIRPCRTLSISSTPIAIATSPSSRTILAIPSISALAGACGRREALRRVDGRGDAAHRAGERPPGRDARQSHRLRRLAAGARRADHAVLRPLRRAAGRSARSVGVTAVRSHGPRRRDLRPRRGRRQGPGVHAPEGHRGPSEEIRHAAGEHQGHLEGEEEVGSSNLDEFVRAEQAATRRRRRRDFRLGHVRSRRAVHLLFAPRPRLLPDRPARHEERPALGRLRRRGGQSCHGARPDPGADEGSRRPHQDPGLLRRRAGAVGGGTGRVEEVAVQRKEIQEGSGRAETRGRAASSRCSSGSGPGRRSK